ncbi:hypothetical protein AGMMS49975_09730 [Clostridia bacterium]|nr:hypothetical protein AGMMS49975_09730 [Clostridia bacterium]
MENKNNRFQKEFDEIKNLCKELEKDYGDGNSWFNPPVDENEILDWERENGLTIPESYKEWLRFSNGSQILNQLAQFLGVKEIKVNLNILPTDFVLIGALIGDGEDLCFSKSTGKIVRYFEGEQTELNDFKEMLEWVIEHLEGRL